MLKSEQLCATEMHKAKNHLLPLNIQQLFKKQWYALSATKLISHLDISHKDFLTRTY